MIRPLFARLLRQHWRMLCALAASLFAFELLLIWITSQLDAGPGLQRMVESFLPPLMRELVSSNFGMLSFDGAVAFGFQHPMAIVATVAFVIAVATIPAGECESGFLDVVLARPVRRRDYVFAVVLLIVLGAAIFPAIQLAGALMGLKLVGATGELSWTRHVPAAFASCLLVLAIGGYTLLLATGARRRGSATAWSVGLTLVFFWVDFTAVLWAPLATLSRLSPFHYFKPIQSVLQGGVRPTHVAVLLLVFVATVAAALVRFDRRDL